MSSYIVVIPMNSYRDNFSITAENFLQASLFSTFYRKSSLEPQSLASQPGLHRVQADNSGGFTVPIYDFVKWTSQSTHYIGKVNNLNFAFFPSRIRFQNICTRSRESIITHINSAAAGITIDRVTGLYINIQNTTYTCHLKTVTKNSDNNIKRNIN